MRRIFRNSVIWGQDDTATNNTVEDDDDDEGGPGVESDPIASLITSSSGSWPKRLNEFEENQSKSSEWMQYESCSQAWLLLVVNW